MLNQLYVFIYLSGDWVPCGLLKFTEAGRNSNSTFRYGRKYLHRTDAIAIDPVQLPLVDTAYETPDGFYVFNGIRDAGPDKWGRYLLERKFARELSELEYIAASGEDRAGALAFAKTLEDGVGVYNPAGIFEKRAGARRLKLEECMGAVDDVVASSETERLRQYLTYGPSLGGARPKAAVIWKGKPHLAKFSILLDTKNEPLIEYATMSLAKKAGLNVPNLELERVDGRSVYLIERFDRRGQEHIPFASGLTLTGTHESDYSAWSYFKLVDAIIKYSARPTEDLEELFRRMVFNIAVYNNDDHPRNFGFLHVGSNRWNLSPLYDVVPSLIHSETYTLAMTLGTEGKRASYSNALSMAARFRLSDARAKKIVDAIKTVVRTWRNHFKEVGATDDEISRLENSFRVKT
ncbi:MAG: type II toxin-antitoxin system HipA family toxin [Bdellovibrionales bacterium]